MSKQLILCDCLGTLALDAKSLSKATGLTCSKMHTELCMGQIGQAEAAIAAGNAIICCQQEQARFSELAEDIDAPEPTFLDLRDRAGWSADEHPKVAKMAALAAEANLPAGPEKAIDVVSDGVCLIIGPSEVALKIADDLADTLAVTVLLTDQCDMPLTTRFDAIRGTVARATGAFGGFKVTLNNLQQIIPGGRGAPELTEPVDGGSSACDVILDFSGAQPLFPAPEKREGYLCADPKSPRDIASVAIKASQMIGTFEKTLYVKLEPLTCAHARAGQIACSNCLNICPTAAIVPDGDHVAIDPMICAGCGACAALCPSGAITYDAPPAEQLFRRIDVLAKTYRSLEDTAPRLLVVDGEHGQQMISLSARFGRGLPADVIPLEVSALAGFGHAEMLAALACGFGSVDVLLGPKTEREALTKEFALAEAVAGPNKLRLLDLNDPDALSDTLFASGPLAASENTILPIGTRRQVARLAAKALQPDLDVIELPADAPYGAVLVNNETCTLCLSCVSLCPSGALGDNPDMPQLRFQEDACLQCGLCANICPENAITLEPQLDLTDTAFNQKVLHEEEPFACIECGALFGVKSTVEKISEKLAGKHSMFATSDAAKMIQMCDNCRVNAQFHSQDNPFTGTERPRPRTTEDYFSKRKDH